VNLNKIKLLILALLAARRI